MSRTSSRFGRFGAAGLAALVALLVTGTGEAFTIRRDDPARSLWQAIRLVRSAQEAFGEGPGGPARSTAALQEARRLLQPFEADRDLRRADVDLSQALADVGAWWLSPRDRQASLDRHGTAAIRRIEAAHPSLAHPDRVLGDGRGWRPGRWGSPEPADWGPDAAPAAPLVARYVKRDYEPAVLAIPIDHLTLHRPYSTIVVDVRATDRFTVIVGTAQVRVNGHWREHPIGHRTREGANSYAVPIPRGATDLRLSLDHGRGAELAVSLR
jgi:hypothetical protein